MVSGVHGWSVKQMADAADYELHIYTYTYTEKVSGGWVGVTREAVGSRVTREHYELQ